MTPCESVVVYDGLPLSSGAAHGLGRVGLHDAHDAWQRFLSTCTQSPGTGVYFEFPHTPGLDADDRLRRAVESVFPGERRRHPVPAARCGEALDLMASVEPLPTNEWGMAPLWLWFHAEFLLRRPDGGVWPHQDPAEFGHFVTPGGVALGKSSSSLTLESRRSMSLHLSLPEATDEEVVETSAWLQAHLSFRLSTKQWTRWTLAKNGMTYRGRKLAL